MDKKRNKKKSGGILARFSGVFYTEIPEVVLGEIRKKKEIKKEYPQEFLEKIHKQSLQDV